jgi:hypothetical protein
MIRRRDFIKMTAAACLLAGCELDQQPDSTSSPTFINDEEDREVNQNTLAGKCGLYCGICTDYHEAKVCKGCGCDCVGCAAHWHHQDCQIYQCAEGKGYDTCADCEDLPCTMLIQFAYDPRWRTHLPVIENCRRIQKTGVESWLSEQEVYWTTDETGRTRWITLYHKCSADTDYK